MRLMLVLALCTLTMPAAAQSLDSLPTPLPASHVADPAKLLAADTRAELDRLATRLDQAGSGQLAFVVVASTSGKLPRQAATDVFNRWGVGHVDRNDGALFLLAKADRKAEIVLGDGIDTPANRLHAQTIMTTAMVPRFREGNYDQGLIVGATELLQRVYGVDLSRPTELPDTAANADAKGDQVAAASLGALDGTMTGDFESTAIAAPVPTDTRTAPPRAAQTRAPVADEPSSPGLVALVLSAIAAALGAAYWVLSKFLRMLWWFTGGRFMARRCGACSSRMELLSEVADDAHLGPGELTEERLKSVDYRIWVCPRCSRVDKLARRAWFSRYGNCASCHSRAVSQVSTTISSPTRYSTGLAEITETCQNCHKVKTERRVLPVLPPPSDNTSSSFSSSSSSSFGGGSSSGGGASGSW